MTRPRVAIGAGAVSDLVSFCGQAGFKRLLVIADQTTHGVLGRTVEESLRRSGCEVRSVILAGPEVVADAHSILQCLLFFDRRDQCLVAVGSGTITDITRFVSHRVGVPFIAMPTAPSVDGFTSLGSPLVVRGIKTTALAHPPLAIFADLAVLCSAPRSMIAAGFGDMMGKHTSVADWRLGSLLWGFRFDQEVADRCLSAARTCQEAAAEIAAATEQGVRRLFEALLESGFCMLDFGSSLPASGAEHHYSHFWEMKLLREGRPAILHGAKVGVATMLAAELYAAIRQLTRSKAAELLQRSPQPSREEELQRIRAAYGQAADDVAETQTRFIGMSSEAWEQLKQKILDSWTEIQEIAGMVPGPEEIARLIHQTGGPASTQELGLSDSDRDQAFQSAHYLRNHFTVAKLSRILFAAGQ